MYDCIIVGAGPAGATAAYHLGKTGHQVLLLEAAPLPRYKPCGGGVSPQIASWFDFDFAPAISMTVSKVRYTLNLEDPVEVELPPEQALWMVRRDIFDHLIVKQAQAQGVTLWDHTKAQGVAAKSDGWQVDTSQGPVRGRFLIAADGARGSMAKWLGFTHRRYQQAAALEAEPRLAVPPEPLIYADLGLLRGGYLWNFPKADGYSIGGGIFRTGGQRRYDLLTPLLSYTETFRVDASQVKPYGHPILIWDGPQPLHTHRAVLAGEAACVVDPFTAEGIRPSIFSGLQAARAVHQGLQGDDQALSRYTEAINREWGEEMRWARRMAGLVYQLPKLTYRVGVKRSSSSVTLVKLFCGEVRYSEVAHRALQRLTGG